MAILAHPRTKLSNKSTIRAETNMTLAPVMKEIHFVDVKEILEQN